jgi:fatty acid desaturase
VDGLSLQQIHHLFPKVPQWEFPAVHFILMQDPIYASLHEKTVGGASHS